MDNIYATFWDHIDDLRKTLLRIGGVIFLGTLFSFFFYEPILHTLTAPLKQDSGLFKHEQIKHIQITNTSLEPQIFRIPSDAIIDGHSDKTKQLMIAPGASLTYARAIPVENSLIVLGPLEGMLIAFKTSLWIGSVGTSPIWLLFLLQFVVPALRKEEKRLIVPFLATSALLIGLGLSVAYFVTIPIANTYLSNFNSVVGLNMWSLSHYLDYTLFLLLANGIAFEFFAVGLFAVHLRVITTSQMVASRRYAIVAAFVLGALLTPPDVLTQLMLAIPLIALYECTILYSRILPQKP